MAAAAAPYITRTSRGSGSLHHADITRLLHAGNTWQRRTAAPYRMGFAECYREWYRSMRLRREGKFLTERTVGRPLWKATGQKLSKLHDFYVMIIHKEGKMKSVDFMEGVPKLALIFREDRFSFIFLAVLELTLQTWLA
ncbi:hypothetical protein STEG23_028668 [Scotinomys teguina]